MCDPTSIGLAISAVGTLAGMGGSYANAQRVEAATEARNRERRDAELRSRMAQQAERDRQLAFENQQMHEQQRVLHEQATPEEFEKDTEAATAKVDTDVSAGLDQVLMDKLPGQGANKTITAQNAATINQNTAALRQQLAAMAKLAGYDQNFADLGIALGQSGQRIATIGSKRAGSARVGQQEMQQVLPDVTENRGMGPDLMIAFGQLAQTAGPMVGGYFGSTGPALVRAGPNMPRPIAARPGFQPGIPYRVPYA
jgi:hypothetical protein